jgi:hypothetical protein
MPLPHENALRASRKVLSALVVINVVYGLAIAGLLIWSFLNRDWVMTALGVRPALERESMVRGMRTIAFIGILAVPLAHVMLTRLLGIVDTVRAGDPFISENAQRLQTIAWTLLGMQVMHVLVGFVASGTRSEVQELDIDWSFSITPWIAVLLLFVLARVFEHGARRSS